MKRLGTTASFGILVAYVLAAFTGVVSHEPWFDEAQSWLLARDAPVGELLFSQLRLEGHPPLWYLLLAVPAKLGLPYLAANVLAAVAAAVGVLLFLRVPSVPFAVRLLVPFGFFVVYQYSVVARSYALFLPLLMGLVLLYPQRRRRVLGFAALLVAMSWVSLHGLALAWAFAALHAFELRRQRPLDAVERRRHAVGLGVLTASSAALTLMLWPPPEILGALGVTPGDVLLRWADVLFFSLFGVFGASPEGGEVIAACLFVVFLLWFHRQGLLLTYLLPLVGVFTINGLLSSRWHEGLFFLVWLFALILSFRRPAPAALRAGATVLSAGVLAMHAWWGLGALVYDARSTYSGSKAAATHLRVNGLAEREVFGLGFAAIGLEPYFETPLLANHAGGSDRRYWDWSRRDPLLRPGPGLPPEQLVPLLDEVLARAPDVVVVGVKFRTDAAVLNHLQADPSYRLLRRFDGGLYWKTRRVEPESFFIFGRVAD